VLAGTIRRGKYTFDKRLELAINEFDASLNADEKNCHGNAAADTSNILGTPLVDELNSHPINAIAKIVINGRSTLQATPIKVCLYLTSTSRHARKKKSPR
jgi:hypothetical protein